jgi:tyrosinase
MERYTRRDFLITAATAASASLLPLIDKRAFSYDAKSPDVTAKYRRYNVSSPQGQKMLASYARGVQAMLSLPASHPQNWFRNAFIHLMDCPHGNWWFYVWHRGYLGYFEQTIRSLSKDPSFAMPYWDWTQQPQIPDGLFDGVLSPTDSAYEPYTGNLAVFTAFIRPALTNYWNSLTPAQRTEQNTRGYSSFEKLWNDVTGYSESADAGISGNEAFAITCGARYLSRQNPKLDPKTSYDVSPFVVRSGLQPTQFYSPDINSSFASSRTPSHNTQPSGATKFSIIEGLPHNKVHNCIGGVGAIDPGPYGNMTNFLSPVDPIFFLHHANIDRLWDVWTRKQIAMGLPYLPTGADLAALANEPFLFYVDGNGQYAGPHKAGEYFSMRAFDYDYQPGFAEDVLGQKAALHAASKTPALQATLSAGGASVTVPNPMIQGHLQSVPQQELVADITLERPHGLSTLREFDVLVNAPADVAQVDADSPYYAGTLAFFGPRMVGMNMSSESTFALPLPKTLKVFSNLGATSTTLSFRLVPSGGEDGHAPPLRSVSLSAS